MRPYGEWRRKAAWCSAAVAVSAGAVIAEAQTRGWDRGQPFYTDVSAGFHEAPLPFDVEFPLLTPPPDGHTPEDVDKVVLVVGERSREACSVQPVDPLAATALCTRFPDDTCNLHHASVKVRPDGAAAGTAPVPHVKIDMPALEVKKDYCLILEYEPSPEQREALRKAAEASISKPGAFSASLTEQGVADLCKQVIREVRAKAEELKLRWQSEPDCPHSLVDAWQSALVKQVGMDNLRREVSRAAADISALLAAQPGPLNEPYQTMRTWDVDRMSQYVLDVEDSTYIVQGRPRDFQEAVDRKNAVQTKIESLVPGHPDCQTEAPPSASGLEAEIAAELAGVCDELANVRDAYEELGETSDTAVEGLAQQLVGAFPLSATTWAGYEGRFYWYVSADQGFAYAFDLEQSFLYTGANIYFRPVNKRAPLDGLPLRQKIPRRFAVVVGLPNEKLDEEAGWDPIVADFPIVVGAGYRFNDHLRFAVGGLIVDEEHPNPLIEDNEGWRLTPFASLSVDIDVVGLFQQLLDGG